MTTNQADAELENPNSPPKRVSCPHIGHGAVRTLHLCHPMGSNPTVRRSPSTVTVTTTTTMSAIAPSKGAPSTLRVPSASSAGPSPRSHTAADSSCPWSHQPWAGSMQQAEPALDPARPPTLAGWGEWSARGEAYALWPAQARPSAPRKKAAAARPPAAARRLRRASGWQRRRQSHCAARACQSAPRHELARPQVTQDARADGRQPAGISQLGPDSALDGPISSCVPDTLVSRTTRCRSTCRAL